MRALTVSLLVPAILLPAALSAVLGACAEDEPAPSVAPPAAHAAPPATPRPGADDASAPKATIDVSGIASTDAGEPVVGRPLVIVDATGRRIESATDAEGRFHAAGVAAPYDVGVAPAPSGTSRVPTIYLGLTRRDPFVELFERDGPSERPPSQTIRVAVKPPPCRSRSCWISVVSASPSGGGGAASAYHDDAPIVFSIDHAWNVAALAGDETIDVHALVGDDERAAYAYVRGGGVSAAPGETADLGTFSPTPIASTAPIVVTTNAAAIPSTWTWTTTAWLDLPGAGTMSLAYVPSSRLTMALPMVPGASFRVHTWAHEPPSRESPELHRSAQGWSRARPVSSSSFAVDVTPGPEILRPTAAGKLSRRGLGFEWARGAEQALATLAVADLARGALRFRVYTAGHEVTLTRLAALGIPELVPGDHIVDLTTSPRVSVDDAASPDALVRLRRFEQSQAGRATYQRAPFQVTP